MESERRFAFNRDWLKHVLESLDKVCSGCPCLQGCDLCLKIVAICQDLNLILNSTESSNQGPGGVRHYAEL